MPKRLSISPHLSLQELKTRYCRTSDPIERTRYQIIWLLAKGLVTAEVAKVTGYSLQAIRYIARRYNQLGTEGLIDRRRKHPGGEPMLSDIEQAELWQVLQAPSPDGGLWNGRKVAQWMSDPAGTGFAARIDRPVSRQRGWEYLRSLTFRWRVPRPEHQQTDYLEQEAWKKNCYRE